MIFSDFLKGQQPFITDYFESVFSVTPPKLANAYLLKGADMMMNYHIALEMAKALNCKCGRNLKHCNCQDGRWIGQNRHPAVITISPVDFKYNEDGQWNEKKSDVIKVEQARYLRTVLATTSDFHRVVIFTGAGEGSEYERKVEQAWNRYKDVVAAPLAANNHNEQRDSWLPLPLNHKVLGEAAANTLLKTIEEPGSKVTFFFLTQDKEDIIETIVSRCCVLNVPSKESEATLFNNISEITSNLPINSYVQAMELAETVNSHLKEGYYSIDEFFNGLLLYLRELVRRNYNDRYKLGIIRGWIVKTEQTRYEIKGYASIQPALDELFSGFIL